MLWVLRKTLGFMLLRSKLISLSPAPHPIQCKGEVTKYALGVQKKLQDFCCFTAKLSIANWTISET